MIVSINQKKTIVITSLGICVLGTLIAALRMYYKSKIRKKQQQKQLQQQQQAAAASSRQSTSERRSSRPGSSRTSRAGSVRSMRSSSTKKERLMLMHAMATSGDDDVKNLPAEELLELGLDYLKQAIRSWETALDSIENAIYMQSQTLALPNSEHADVVLSLRRLLDNANNINLQNCSKLVKTSQTLQIIQSRLAIKQQLYAEALLRNNEEIDEATKAARKNEQIDEENEEEEREERRSLHRLRSGLMLSDEDNESFRSAESDVDWVDEDLMRRFELIEITGEKNLLYEMGMNNVNMGRVTYRLSRASLLDCKSDEDFAAKLYVIRLGFDRLLQDADKKQWFIGEGKQLLTRLMTKAEKDCAGIYKCYDEMCAFVQDEHNLKAIKEELATRDVTCFNFYDIALDFILLDAFEDLESPPSAITAVIQNRWLSQSFKETALSTACWSVLKAKRKLMKYPDGFMSRFYSINEYLAPVLAWGF